MGPKHVFLGVPEHPTDHVLILIPTSPFLTIKKVGNFTKSTNFLLGNSNHPIMVYCNHHRTG